MMGESPPGGGILWRFQTVAQAPNLIPKVGASPHVSPGPPGFLLAVVWVGGWGVCARGRVCACGCVCARGCVCGWVGGRGGVGSEKTDGASQAAPGILSWFWTQGAPDPIEVTYSGSPQPLRRFVFDDGPKPVAGS